MSRYIYTKISTVIGGSISFCVGDVVGFGEGGEEWPGEVSRWRSLVRRSVADSGGVFVPFF
jgi:hypothetical protein